MSLEIARQRIKTAKETKSQVLNLSNLGLTQLPEEISELTQLTYLFLENNQLAEINALESLKKLEVLHLNNNQLTELPVFLGELDLKFQFKELSRDILGYIFIVTARALAQNLARARDLDLARDLYRDLTIDLDLARDLYRDLTIDLDLYRDLTIDLDLARARALARDLYRALARDRTIYLARDLDRTLDRARNRARDRNLALDRDRARALDLDIDRAREIALDQYTTLDRALKLTITYYQGIYIKNNPLIAPPLEIIDKGDYAIRTFLKEFLEKQYLNEVKVIIVGEGASGKTSLVKRLINKKFNKKEKQTHGIRIVKEKYKYGEKDLLVNFWDFGGQEIMHATHQFFLTKRCLYVLVLDSRKDEKAEYWLNYIQSFGGDAPVLVVINKIDENPSFDVNRKFLNKKYPNILKYYKVSCLTESGIPALKEELLEHLWKLELRNTPFPKNWLKVKKALEGMTADYINYSKYRTLCNNEHVHNAQSQKVLLQLLNDLGVVLNYDSLKYYDTQVLNPLWLTNAVYRIINSPILAKSEGKFHINDLDAIINDPRYQKENPEHWSNIFKFWQPEQKLDRFPEEKFLFIVAMMKQFELLFQIDEFHYLIPGLLPDEENTYDFNPNTATLSFIIEYEDFLPTAIIPRLMVKLNKYIYEAYRWKTGMVLEEKLLFKSIANIVLDKEDRKILIEISGQRNRDFLTMIRETIKEINTTYQGLDVVEWVPLPELHKGEQLLVDYQELLGYEAAKQLMYFSGKLRKAFPVDDLLNGIEKPESRKVHRTCNIFLSYAHKDQDYKERLVEHLMPLVRLNKATLWDDNCIVPGEQWNDSIFDMLEQADIVLCLISSGFIASEFCHEKELATAMEAHQKETKTVIPIKIKEVHWDNLEIAKLQGLPLNWLNDIDDDKSWAQVARGIEMAINKVLGK